jgi:hypothetical protein
MPIAENLRANVKKSWGDDADVVYATFDKSCCHEDVLPEGNERSQRTGPDASGGGHHTHRPLPHVVYSRLTEESSALSHCSRDMDSVTRALWTWETIKVPTALIFLDDIFVTLDKRGVSVVNSDPDVIFFRPIPLQCVATIPQRVFVTCRAVTLRTAAWRSLPTPRLTSYSATPASSRTICRFAAASCCRAM